MLLFFFAPRTHLIEPPPLRGGGSPTFCVPAAQPQDGATPRQAKLVATPWAEPIPVRVSWEHNSAPVLFCCPVLPNRTPPRSGEATPWAEPIPVRDTKHTAESNQTVPLGGVIYRYIYAPTTGEVLSS